MGLYYSLGMSVVGLLFVVAGWAKRGVVGAREAGLTEHWVWSGSLVEFVRGRGGSLVRCGIVKGDPCPRFVGGVKGEAVLWAALVHLLALLPEHLAFSVVAWVRSETVDAFESPWLFPAGVSLVGSRAFPAVHVLGFAFTTLVAKSVASETSYGLFVWLFRYNSFVEYIRTLL